jgi:hypothetical protein
MASSKRGLQQLPILFFYFQSIFKPKISSTPFLSFFEFFILLKLFDQVSANKIT